MYWQRAGAKEGRVRPGLSCFERGGHLDTSGQSQHGRRAARGGIMPRFSANLSMLFTELPFLDRFAAAAHAGFAGVEYISPYEHPPQVIADLLVEHGLEQALFNLPLGDWEKGERGIAIYPERIKEFRAGVEMAARYAQVLGNKRVNCICGLVPRGAEMAVLQETLEDNLAYASARLAEIGVDLMIEPINTHDIPDFFLTGSQQAIDIMDAVGAANLKLQYDIYHMQIMEGDLSRRIETLLPRIGHIQIADNPGRHQPGTGEINFAHLFAHLDAIGYDGWVGAEYRPTGATGESLAWLKPARQA
jgi:hydroxypyruvate isomerase